MRRTAIVVGVLVVLALGVGVAGLVGAFLFGPEIAKGFAVGYVDGKARTHRVRVGASDDWATLDVAVNPGDIVRIASASGEWRIKPACDMVGWQGHPAETCSTILFDGRIVKTAKRGALLWRSEGMEGSAFVAEVGERLQISEAGRLQFRINDDSVVDNEGALDVEVAVSNM